MDGDSGSWVVDEVTNELLGHVVASDILGDIYVVPACDTFDSIRRFLDLADISLPSPEDQILPAVTKLAERNTAFWLTPSEDPTATLTDVSTVPKSLLVGLPGDKSLVKKRGPQSSFDGSVDSGFFGSNTRDDVSEIDEKVSGNEESHRFPAASSKLARPGQEHSHKISRRSRQEHYGDDISEADEEDFAAGDKDHPEQTYMIFACPFLKHDPMRYPDCCSYTLLRIRDVKQHILRKHSLTPYCPTCYHTFTDEDERDHHVSARNCEISRETKPAGVTEAQKRQLAKKAPPSMTSAEQWYQIFDLIFPHSQNKPSSPYFEMDRTLLRSSIAYQQFLEKQGVSMLRDFLRACPFPLQIDNRHAEAFQTRILAEGLRAIFDCWANRDGLRAALPSTATSQGTSDRLPGLSLSTPSAGSRSSHSAESRHSIPANPIPATSALEQHRDLPVAAHVLHDQTTQPHPGKVADHHIDQIARAYNPFPSADWGFDDEFDAPW